MQSGKRKQLDYKAQQLAQKSKVKKVTMLADKIEAREAQKAAEEALRMHKLNYYELVAI
jgi:hypothetical protein